MFHKDQIVVFGRPQGQKTLARVLRVNAKSLGLVTMEERGREHVRADGGKWRVAKSLCRPATDAEVNGTRTSGRSFRPVSETPARPRRPEAEILRDLLNVECLLSPEHLHADGERPMYQVRKLRAKLNRQRRELVAELGREPTDAEIWGHWKTRGADWINRSRLPSNQAEATVRVFNPKNWKSLDAVSRLKPGDAVRNPVASEDTDATRKLAADLDLALAKRGLRLDHTEFSVNFVESIE